MKRILMAALCLPSLALPAFAQQTQTAVADFIGADGKETGRAALTQGKDGVLIEVEVSGLPPGTWVGFHIHENGVCDAKGHHESAGGHFNPGKKEHGFLAVNGPHAGDMPNLYVDKDGTARAHVYNGHVTLNDDNAIRGKALMIHARSDDYRSQPAGDAGERLACAVVK